ncbi:hypothetical protein JVT61DRAFT_10612 [Boletus reticuloceps]|uniref:Uncharacterized protein n=1 Tax=Boletus reticuloceps TaxID=495285 RepID=A0A8I2YFN2_9AGAM|nr:hypothetical protein JVT61DRAFT_10612 [Boletus reticuloceps]
MASILVLDCTSPNTPPLGAYIVIAWMNLALLQKKRYKILLSYSIVQLVLTTLYFAISLYAAPAQSLAIFNIVGSYGPDALSPWPIVIVNVAFVLNTWASDDFLLYRCYVVCMAHKSAVAFPILLYLATLGSSIAWLIVGSTPGAVYSTHAVQVTGICFWTCSAAMNICASCLISVRFWMYRQAIMRAIGSRQGAFYLGYMAMTLESALLYTVTAIIALVVFILNSPLENVFFPVLGTVQAIAPALIIYRIARGISLETDERGTILTQSLQFSASGPPMRSAHQDFFDGSGTVHVSSGESDKTDKDGSDSFIQQVKHDSQV